MSKKVQPTQWSENVRQAVGKFAGTGIQIAPPTSLFHWCEHVTVSVAGLDGVGIIHQRDRNESFNFCVFEPSSRENDGYAEIFERKLASLDELPKTVAAWRSFRSRTKAVATDSGLMDHRDWLSVVAKEKRKLLDAMRESGRLRAAGDIAAAWEAAGISVKIGPQLPEDTPAIASRQMLADFNAISPGLLAWHLPRDGKGKLHLKRRVPLFRYDFNKRSMSAYCLLVAMPDKRSGRPELRAAWLQADLQTVRLDAVPELFDTRLAADFAPELLGANASSWWSSRPSAGVMAMEMMRLQYEGNFEKAGALAGLELDDLIMDCLHGRRVAHMCACCAPLDQQLIDWAAVLRQALTQLNFSRLCALVWRDQERRGRKPPKQPIPIIPFPSQRHIRKAHLALDISNCARPRLTIDTTGSGTRVPLAVWQRPVDVDLLREGLFDSTELPEDVALQMGISTALNKSIGR